MRKPVVIIGIGEMAGVFARGFLRSGHPVYPITRNMEIAAEAPLIPEPALVLITVAENDLDRALALIPPSWHNRLALLQNELLPLSWQAHGLKEPTVISVWFEKKPGQDVKTLISSPIYGPNSQVLAEALHNLAIPCHIVSTEEDMLYELVRKNLYIVTTNVAGLEVGGTVSDLWQQYEPLTRQIVNEILDIQEWLVEKPLSRARLIDGMLEAFDGDPQHKCMGRSAPARLERAIKQATEANLAVPTLDRIAANFLCKHN